ncbi:hypothetical protein BY458DRAFT_431094, partial [Sporodiniella umbellata]
DVGEKINKKADTEKIVEEFQISSKVKDVQAFLTGPPQYNMLEGNYLDLVGELSATRCYLDGHTILIEGSDQKAVNETSKRFEQIERTYIKSSRKTRTFCIHYPVESEPYKLVFCPLSHYRYKRLIPVSQTDRYILLPVFYDRERREYKQPKNMIIPKQTSRMYTDSSCSLVSSPSTSAFNPFSPKVFESSSSLERELKNVHVSQNVSYLSTEILERAFQPPSATQNDLLSRKAFPISDNLDPTQRSLKTEQHAKESSQSLEPVVLGGKATTQRVLKILPQKSIGCSLQPHSQLMMAKEYNFKNIKYALDSSLDAVRGHKGEVKLFAKVTNRDDIVNDICRILPGVPEQKSFYEFHCLARNQRRANYKNMVLYMKNNITEVDKVVYSNKKVVEINWASLDRHLDFQIALSLKETIRADVKPFTTFVKTISVDPVAGTITLEEVEGFLKVNHILHKKEFLYSFDQYRIAITRVQKFTTSEAPMNYHQIRRQIIAELGDVSYEIEVFDLRHTSLFDLNEKLGIGKAAGWFSTDIMGANYEQLNNFVLFLITFIEKTQEKFNLVLYLVILLAFFGLIVFILLFGENPSFRYVIFIPIHIISLYTSYYVACTADPGIITRQNLKKHLDHYPYDGLIYTPKDCSTCKFQNKMDHHCAWINGCIYRGMIVEWGLDKAYMYDPTKKESVPVSFVKAFLYVLQHDRVIGAIGILGSVVSLVVFVFFIYQLYLAARGITTNEAFKWEMVEDAIDRGELYKDKKTYKRRYRPLNPPTSEKRLLNLDIILGHLHAFYILVKEREQRELAGAAPGGATYGPGGATYGTVPPS